MPFVRECVGCGNTFDTENYRQKRCQKSCGRVGKNEARRIKALTNDIEFVGVDGEGVDRPDGSHEYVMLSVGDKTLTNGGYQLELKAMLEFLWECFQEKPHAAFVGFFLGYDFIQWEKQLPEERAALLLTKEGVLKRKSKVKGRLNPYPDAVVWEGWEIDIMAGRRFKLRPHLCHRSEWTGKCRNRTCQKDMGYDNSYGEPETIQAGEMEFEPTDDGTEWTGSFEELMEATRIKHSHNVGKGKVKGKAHSWMYICDTGPFWQTSFLNVINPKAWDGKPVCSDEEFQIVVRGKANRGETAERDETHYLEEMRQYNVLENDILARVTSRLNQGFMNERIPIKIPKADWYGPGRAAQLWMDQLHALCSDPDAREYNKYVTRNNGTTGNPKLVRKNETGLLNVDVYTTMPEWYYEAAKASYYGGWFEQFIHGHVGDVWEYDINSAYPHIIATLPCLHTTNGHNGLYSEGVGPRHPGIGYVLLYAKVKGSNPHIGAMPFRTQQGLISRPQQTEGWYWLHEIEASKRAGLIDSVEVERWVSYEPCTCTPPFNPESIGITSLYQLRLDFGKNTPQGKSAKLVYNSAYGKTAQSIGEPKYSNPVYASLITAGCRTLILEAISSHPLGSAGVSMVATDGVYFLDRHPGLRIDPARLGAWDETYKENITQLMPGVYWDEKARESVKAGGSPKLKSRGVSGRDLAQEIGRLDRLFAVNEAKLKMGDEYEWPTITFTTSFLLDSARSALQRGKWDTAGRVTHGASRSISSDPFTKRVNVPVYDTEWECVRTVPYRVIGDGVTTPYHKSFGYQELEEQELFGDSVGYSGEDPMQYWKDVMDGVV